MLHLKETFKTSGSCFFHCSRLTESPHQSQKIKVAEIDGPMLENRETSGGFGFDIWICKLKTISTFKTSIHYQRCMAMFSLNKRLSIEINPRPSIWWYIFIPPSSISSTSCFLFPFINSTKKTCFKFSSKLVEGKARNPLMRTPLTQNVPGQ